MQIAQSLQEHTQDSLPDVSREQILKYLDTFGLTNELSEQEKSQFIEIAQAYKLNPFRREVYAVPYGEGSYRKLSIITGFEVYLKRAERTGKLDGWAAWIEGSSEEDFKAVVEIHRRDWHHPFKHEVFWKEAVQRKRDGSLTSFWAKMPRYQLRKVCISQAFRLAFPDELSGMPYTNDELPEEMTNLSSHNEESSPSATAAEDNSSSSRLQIGAPLAETQVFPSGEQEDPRVAKITARLSDNASCFTSNHSQWILSQIKNNPSEDNLNKMENHIEVVIKSKTITKPLRRMENRSRQQESQTSSGAQILQPAHPSGERLIF